MPNNFINNFLIYCSELESPLIFQEISAYTLLASILDKRIRVRRGYFCWDTAIYSMVVGNQGLGKSAALDIGLDILHNDLKRERHSIVGNTTARALMNNIQKVSQDDPIDGSITSVTITPDEAKNFFSLSAEDMVGFLTENYNNDKDFVYRTANYGEVFIPNPYVVFQGNSTIEWVEGNFSDELLNGGFARRCLFVYASKKSKSNPEPEITMEMLQAREACVDRLKEISNRVQLLKARKEFDYFQITEEANEWYKNWYIEHDKKDHGYLISFATEKRVHLHKYAMLYSLSRKNELILELEDFLAANEFLTRVEGSMGRVFRAIGKNYLNALAEDLKGFLKGKGWLPFESLVKQFVRDANTEQIRSALEVSRITGEIEQKIEGVNNLFYRVQ